MVSFPARRVRAQNRRLASRVQVKIRLAAAARSTTSRAASCVDWRIVGCAVESCQLRTLPSRKLRHLLTVCRAFCRTGMLPPSSIQETSGLRGLGRACIPTRLGNCRTDEIAGADHRSRGVALCQCRPPCIFLSHQTAAASCITLHSSSGEARRKVACQRYAERAHHYRRRRHVERPRVGRSVCAGLRADCPAC